MMHIVGNIISPASGNNGIAIRKNLTNIFPLKMRKASAACCAVLTSIVVVAAVYAQSEISADEILNEIDKNMISVTSVSTGKMIIHQKNRVLTKEIKSWNRDKKTGFIEFTSPARDKGTKYLRLDDNLWMYLPSIEKVIKISGHLLRQSMMGGDFSYEDLLDKTKLLEDYTATVVDEEQFADSPCYVLELIAVSKEITYYRKKLWVDKNRFVALKSEMYAKTGKLLKMMTVENVEFIQGRYYPTHIVMQDLIRKNSRTEFVVTEIEFDVNIPASVFTMRNLEKR